MTTEHDNAVTLKDYLKAQYEKEKTFIPISSLKR
jgi:hypothetical protein